MLAQLRQPGRAIHSDLISTTFNNFLKVLLNRRNFNMKKEVDGQLLVQPSWSHCLSYEHELRKEACKRCRTRSIGIAAALQSTYEDNEHRTRHWVQLVAMANSAKEKDAKVARLEREVQELRNMVGCSRSPRMQPRQKALPVPPLQLALPASQSAERQRQRANRSKKGSDKGGKNNRGCGSVAGSSSSTAALIVFDQLMKMGQKATKLFHQSNLDRAICFNFQKHQCTDPSVCNRRHACIGCSNRRQALQ